MNYLVENLSDDYLREIASYFSQLDLPYPPPQTTGAPAALLKHGETLALHGDPARELPACAQCHGSALTGVAPSIPGLLGLPRDYLNAQLGAWKQGQRHAAAPDCMAQIADKLSPEDVSALSTWLSSQAVTDNARPAPALEHRLPIPCGDVDEGAAS
jgi:cytochrome c553